MTRVRIRGDGWTAFMRDGQWIAKLKLGGAWGQHRVPRPIQTEDRVRRYIHAFLRASNADAKARPVSTALETDASTEIHSDMPLRQLARLWTEGELARRYPDHVRTKRSARSDRARLSKHVLPFLGDRRISEFAGAHGLELANTVMRKLPGVEILSRDSRRHVAQLLHRLLSLAVYPLMLLSAHPLPRGWLPRGGDAKARSYLYPAEDEQLMQCTAIPLLTRLFYGFLAREGLRAAEARELSVRDVDLERGSCSLDANKTDDPRAWALSPGVVIALRRYLERFRPSAAPDDLLFIDPAKRRPPGDNLARALRRDLLRSGVRRPQLFVNNTERKQIRGHDLRATFVTTFLAAGHTETWVADRTGHKSTQMIARYRRLARTHAELNLGLLKPLVTLLPELADASTEIEPRSSDDAPPPKSDRFPTGTRG